MLKLRLILGLLGLSIVLGALAVAQNPAAPVLTLSSLPNTLALGPNDTEAIVWTVRNAGQLQGTVALTLATPTGWAGALADADRSFTLASGDSRPIRVTVRPSTSTPANGTFQLSGTLTYPGSLVDSEQSAVSVNFLAPPVPPLPPPPPAKSYLWEILGAVGGAVFLGGYVVQAGQARIRLPEKSIRVNIGTDGVVFVGVGNASPLPTRVRLRIRNLPAPFVAAFSSPEVHLAGRETLQVPLLIRVPHSAHPGEKVRFQLHARPNGFSPWLTRKDVDLETSDVRIGAA